jgi:ribosomal protein S18 acetylase RimI-like enzyme
VAAKRVQVGPVADGAIEAAGAAIARAFQDQPILQYTLPDPTERTRRAPALFAQGLRLARLVGAAFAPVKHPTGAAFGWPIPADDPTPEQAAAAGLEPLPDLLGEATYGRFAELTGYVAEQQALLVPPPCWHLSALGVDPAHQGQGIGSALVRAFLARSAADGVPTGLWTDTPANVGFYRGLGLELVGEGIAPGSGVPYWIFRRDPV